MPSNSKTSSKARSNSELHRHDPEAIAAAERHLADLRKHHPARPAETRDDGKSPGWMRARFEREAVRVRSRREAVRQAWDAPDHPLGGLVTRARLWGRPTIGMRTIGSIVFLAAVAVVVFWPPPFVSDAVSETVRTAFFGGALATAAFALWGDVFRLPYLSWKIRHRILKRPWSVLPTTARKRQAELMARDEATRIVPRHELHDELLPGILDRSQRDTQVVVGEPGAGKTTALVDISKLLARIGLVPVVVQLWGDVPTNIVDMAKERFLQHARGAEHSETRLEELWQWLHTHRRLVILVDDLDRIAPDGDRGFLLRRALGELADESVPAVITTRPAGIPAGVAASAISLEKLSDDNAARHVLAVAREQRGTSRKTFDSPATRGNVELWIEGGRLAEVPLYLELLARLVAAERCEDLAPAETLAAEGEQRQVIVRADGKCEWNPLWVRFRLLERFYDEMAEGTVHRWLGIDERERASCLESLSEAALAQLVAISVNAQGNGGARRDKIEDFLDANDRVKVEYGQRRTISAHEVVNTAERLRMLDRDPDGGLHFRHRILQAYLAGRYLARELGEADELRKKAEKKGKKSDKESRECAEAPDRFEPLLDPRHPERMTANMTLVFAALHISDSRQSAQRDGAGPGNGLVVQILDEQVGRAEGRLPPKVPEASKRAEKRERERIELEQRRDRLKRLDPLEEFDFEMTRVDPDDALGKLTTAAEIAVATAAGDPRQRDRILELVERAAGATRWTKLDAIPAIGALKEAGGKQWARIWEFARDPDHKVRRVASTVIADDAACAYEALEKGIEALIVQAARKSSRDLPLDRLLDGAWYAQAEGSVAQRELAETYGITNEKDEILSLKALGWVLPAIVSGLREHPRQSAGDGSRSGAGRDGAGKGEDNRDEDEPLRAASRWLERLVSLAFQKRFPGLEAAVAQGFKNDAMRHLGDPDASGPGRVESNRQLVTDICLDNACNWYARLVLHQALALYTVGGSAPDVALGAFQRALDGDEAHPLVMVAADQARRVVLRSSVGSTRWSAFVWADEGDATSRRQPLLNPDAAMLVADVTLLLNLDEIASEDRSRQLARMSDLPHCLYKSPDRLEILGAGCPKRCAYGFCPLKEAPVDEPDGQRAISRAFCRGMQRVAARRTPRWQKGMKKGAMKEFWHEMETRART